MFTKKLLICTDYAPLAKAISKSVKDLDCGVVRLVENSEYIEGNMLRVLALQKPTHVLISYPDFDIRKRDLVAEIENSGEGARVGILHMNIYGRNTAKKRDYETYDFPGRKDLRRFVIKQREKRVIERTNRKVAVA